SMGLAPRLLEQIFSIIGDFKRRGLTVLLVEQNAQAALAVADRGYVIETGRITISGSGRALIADERVRAAYLGLCDRTAREKALQIRCLSRFLSENRCPLFRKTL